MFADVRHIFGGGESSLGGGSSQNMRIGEYFEKYIAASICGIESTNSMELGHPSI